MDNLQEKAIELPWSFAKKLFFRFFFIFFILYTIPFPIGYIPGLDFINTAYSDLLHIIIPWIGATILNLEKEITTFTNGSGDTTYDYVLVLFFFSISIFGTIIWSLLDIRRQHYKKLYYWLEVLVRYYFGYMMLVYGFAKVFKLQFSSPNLYRLVEPYGDSSPMGLVWTFMGYSTSYTIFTGLGEVVGGMLLFHRKTRLLGSLILITVMSNVVMINFSYDVPVKLFSSTLLIMALFLSAKDLQRMINFFFLNRTVKSVDLPNPFISRKMRMGAIVVKSIVIVYMFYSQISSSLESQSKYGDKAPKAPLYGYYELEDFVLNGDTIPPLMTDTTRWKAMRINWKGYANIHMMNDSKKRYKFEPDTTAHKIVMYHEKGNQDSTKYELTYKMVEEKKMLMEGVLFNDTISFLMNRKDPEDFLLVNRGFNWINERPFNR